MFSNILPWFNTFSFSCPCQHISQISIIEEGRHFVNGKSISLCLICLSSVVILMQIIYIWFLLPAKNTKFCNNFFINSSWWINKNIIKRKMNIRTVIFDLVDIDTVLLIGTIHLDQLILQMLDNITFLECYIKRSWLF